MNIELPFETLALGDLRDLVSMTEGMDDATVIEVAVSPYDDNPIGLLIRNIEWPRARIKEG